MRKIALLLMIWPLLAVAQDDTETFSDKGSGLVVKMPEGWDRETRREQGSIRFSAMLSLARRQYVAFEVSAVRARYDMDEWVAAQKATLGNVFKDTSIPFAVDKSFKVGGKSAVLVTMGGKRASKSGEEYDLRVRYAGVANGDIFLTIQEMSYNGAHEKEPKSVQAMWDALRFETPEGELGGGGAFEGGNGGEAGGNGGGRANQPVNTEPTKVEDKAGNYKVTLPGGWLVVTEPPEDDDDGIRMVAERMDDRGDPIGRIRVLRLTSGRAADFTLGTPSEILVDRIDKNIKWFEQYYGDNTAGTRPPRVNEGILLGNASKSGEFEYRSITNKEEAKIREAETLQRRGEKIEIPEYKDIVVRGRIALISPHIYFVEVVFDRSLGDDEKMLAEYKAIMDSWEFGSTEPMPAPLQLGSKEIGNTLESSPKERKGETVFTLTGRRPYRLQCTFLLPPGLMWIEEKLGPNIVLGVVGQDDKNNWVRIIVAAMNHNEAGERNMQLSDKNEQFATWASNWESKARGAKIPRKPQSVRLGISGKGYKKLEGTIEGHRGTFSGALDDMKGWRIVVEVETRGDGDEVFKDQLKVFFRKLKFKSLK